MKVRLHHDLELYRAELIPISKVLEDLAETLNVFLPKLVMLQVTTYRRYFCYLTTQNLSSAQSAMTKLITGSPSMSNVTYDYSAKLRRARGTLVRLHKFELIIADKEWLDLSTVRNIMSNTNENIVFYVPVEGYNRCKVYTTDFYIPCSEITVTTRIT